MNVIDKFNIETLNKYRALMEVCKDVDFANVDHFKRLSYNLKALTKDLDCFVYSKEDENILVELYCDFPDEEELK